MLVPLITKYLILAKKSNWSEYRKKINSFLLAVQSTEEMKNACRTIGIDIYITELLTLKAQLDANFVPVSYTHLDVYKRQDLTFRRAF